MRFEFATSNRIIFGEGTVRDLGQIAATFGTRCLLVHGHGNKNFEAVQEILTNSRLTIFPFEVLREPTISLVENGVSAARQANADVVISLGGGSVIDTGKAISAMLTNPGDLLDYLEVVGSGKSISSQPAPFIAVSTTAGTGSEVTRNAVLAVPEKKFKVSMRSPLMLPRIALVDPELTYSMPVEVTASTGMDALTQVLEPFVSVRANAMTDLYAAEGLKMAGISLLRVFENPDDRNARREMSLISLYGGISLANAGLGAVHGFAAPLGGIFDAPHGALCARLLPAVVQINVQALKSRSPDHFAYERYIQAANLILRRPGTAIDLIDWLYKAVKTLKIPLLREYGMTLNDIPSIAEKAKAASSMKGNPIQLTDSELSRILELSM